MTQWKQKTFYCTKEQLFVLMYKFELILQKFTATQEDIIMKPHFAVDSGAVVSISLHHKSELCADVFIVDLFKQGIIFSASEEIFNTLEAKLSKKAKEEDIENKPNKTDNERWEEPKGVEFKKVEISNNAPIGLYKIGKKI